MKIFKIIVLVLFTAYSTLSSIPAWSFQEQSDNKITVGILALESKGISEDEGDILTNRLYSSLVRSKAFQVLEMAKIKELIKEQKLQLAGFTKEEYAAKVGEMLGAKWMIAGSAGKIGRTYSVDTRVIETETRKVIFSTSRDHRGEIDGLLDVVESIADKIVEKYLNYFERGRMVLSSEPQGAEIRIDGEFYGTTPDTLFVDPGQYRVMLSKEHYFTEIIEMTVKKGDVKKRHIEMTGISQPKRKKIWPWILAGAAVVGGGIVYAILSLEDEEEKEGDVIGMPPEPPNK